MVFPRLYVVLDKATMDARGLRVSTFAEEMAQAALRIVQYRDKAGAPQEVLACAAEIANVFQGTGTKLVLNDRADLAALLGWGVHVGQGDLLPADARRLVGERVVGVSTHSEQQALRCAQDDNFSAADYVAIGPVFRTSTKPDAEPVVGLEGVRRARALTTKPLVAIGGITRENARSVIDAGADSVAVISGLFVPGMTVRDVAREFLELLG